MVRGGSWNNNQDPPRADYRNNNHPDNRNDNNGFRVLCASHIHHRCSGYRQVRPIVRQPAPAVGQAQIQSQLWDWKQAIVDRLAELRLTVHAGSAQVAPVAAGVPWLGFVVYPTHRHVKARKAIVATRQLTARFDAWRAGQISFAEFDAGVQGWINHVRYADS